MGSKAPNWADQWGEGGMGDQDNYDKPMGHKDKMGLVGHGSNKKMDAVKAAASTGFDKAKSAAVTGAQKVKTGTSMGFKWAKNKCQKKGSSSN